MGALSAEYLWVAASVRTMLKRLDALEGRLSTTVVGAASAFPEPVKLSLEALLPHIPEIVLLPPTCSSFAVLRSDAPSFTPMSNDDAEFSPARGKSIGHDDSACDAHSRNLYLDEALPDYGENDALPSLQVAASTIKVVKPTVKQLRDPSKLGVKVEAVRAHKGRKLDDVVAEAAILGSLRGSQSRAPQLDKVDTRATTAATPSTLKKAATNIAARAASTAPAPVGAAALLTTAARAAEAAASASRFAESASVDDTSGDDEDEDEDAIQEGCYWRHISSSTSSELDQLENIGALACTCLHGHVVRSALKQLSRTGMSSLPIPVVAEVAAKVIAKSWQRRNLSGLLRSDYDGLVLLLSEMLAAAFVEDDHTPLA
jgi:hypothetical protein